MPPTLLHTPYHSISHTQISCVEVPACAPQPRGETDAIQISQRPARWHQLVYPQRTRLTHATLPLRARTSYIPRIAFRAYPTTTTVPLRTPDIPLGPLDPSQQAYLALVQY